MKDYNDIYLKITKICNNWSKLWNYSDDELNITQLMLLEYLSSHGGKGKATDFSHEYSISVGGVTGTVDKLANMNMITLEQTPDDRRVKIIKITPKGLDRLRSIKQKRCEMIKRVLEKYNDEDMLNLKKYTDDILLELNNLLNGGK